MNDLTHKDLCALLALNHPSMKGTRQTNAFFEEGYKPAEVLNLYEQNPAYKEKIEKVRREFDPVKELQAVEGLGAKIVSRWDEEFPELLRQIPDPPLLLYCLGNISILSDVCVAIVGSRHGTFYGQTQTRRLSRDLVAAGITIVSGLARGIDQFAHETALQHAENATIAVLGSGLDRIYPRENRKLFESIVKNGLVISEYPLGTKPFAWNFPRRNRIIAGLSLGVLVIEAHRKSGSLITAKEALDQGREVFAVPGPIDQITSSGTHYLIKEGAVLTENAEDVLTGLKAPLRQKLSETKHELPLFHKEQSRKRANEVEERLQGGPLRFEELLQGREAKHSELSFQLLDLELGGRIKKGADGRYQLAST